MLEMRLGGVLASLCSSASRQEVDVKVDLRSMCFLVLIVTAWVSMGINNLYTTTHETEIREFREFSIVIIWMELGQRYQLNLHCEKSSSGWAFMNSFNFYCFCNSSLVGKPACFWRISNIIFSTVDRVSPSRSESLEGSGLIFWVLI